MRRYWTPIGAALLAAFCTVGAARASKDPANIFGAIRLLEHATPFTKQSVSDVLGSRRLEWKPAPEFDDQEGVYESPDSMTMTIDLRPRGGPGFLVLDNMTGRCIARQEAEREFGALRPFDVSVAHGRNGPRGGLLISWFAQRPWGKLVVWFTDENEGCLKGVAFHVGAR